VWPGVPLPFAYDDLFPIALIFTNPVVVGQEPPAVVHADVPKT
jgi:hypothetical protein